MQDKFTPLRSIDEVLARLAYLYRWQSRESWKSFNHANHGSDKMPLSDTGIPCSAWILASGAARACACSFVFACARMTKRREKDAQKNAEIFPSFNPGSRQKPGIEPDLTHCLSSNMFRVLNLHIATKEVVPITRQPLFIDKG